MSDRSVRLDLATAGLAERQSEHSAGGGGREAASEEDMMRFRQALQAPAPGEPAARDAVASAEPEEGQAAEQVAPRQARGAFGLFGRSRGDKGGQTAEAGVTGAGDGALAASAAAPLVPGSAGAAAEEGAADRARRLTEALAQRILIAADGGREARITLRADVMPGVELHLLQEQGRWVVRFDVTDATSFEQLARAGKWMADELARRLRSGIEIRMTDRADAEPNAEPACAFFADPPAAQGTPSEPTVPGVNR